MIFEMSKNRAPWSSGARYPLLVSAGFFSRVLEKHKPIRSCCRENLPPNLFYTINHFDEGFGGRERDMEGAWYKHKEGYLDRVDAYSCRHEAAL